MLEKRHIFNMIIKMVFVILCLSLLIFSTFAIVGCSGKKDQNGEEQQKITYNVVVENSSNGSLIANKTGKVEKDSIVEITIRANDGYILNTIKVNGQDRTSEVLNGKISISVTNDITVAATFVEELFTITGNVTLANGTYEGLEVTLLKGTKQYTATLDAEGNYSARVGRGKYSVKVTHPIFETTYKDGIEVSSNMTIDAITLKDYSLGNSALGAEVVGTWNSKDGVYQSSSDRCSSIYVKGVTSNQYIFQTYIVYESGYGIARPAIILGQDSNWRTVLSFNLVERNTDWIEIVRVSNQNIDTWEYMDNSISLGLCGLREDGITLTVVRENSKVTAYIDGEVVFTENNCNWLSNDELPLGLFTDCAVATYSHIDFTENLSELDSYLSKAIEYKEGPIGDPQNVDVIILAGQSNAAGVTKSSYLATTDSAMYAKALEGYDNVFIKYSADTNYSGRFVNVKLGQGTGVDFYGPEIGIADWYSEHYPDKKLYIIKCAWGGTNLYSQWASESSLGTQGNLYTQFIEFVDNSLEYMEARNLIPDIIGFCWMQGEADGVETHMTQAYYDRLTNLVGDVRNRYGEYKKNGEISFVDATIAQINYWPYASTINAQKAFIERESNYNFLVNTQELQLTTDRENNDLAHYDSLSMITLGRNFGEKLFAMEEAGDKTLVCNNYTDKQDAVVKTAGEGDNLVTAKISRYDNADYVVIYLNALDNNGFSIGDKVEFALTGVPTTKTIKINATSATINGNVNFGTEFLWRMTKTQNGYEIVVYIAKTILGGNTEGLQIATTIYSAIVQKDENLGDSPIGNIAERGEWNLVDGVLVNSSRSWTFFDNVGTRYAVEAVINLIENGSCARPGLVIAQNEEWIIAFALQLNDPTGEWVGLIRVSATNPNTWQYMDGNNGTMTNSFVRSESFGAKTENGAKLTAIRDGNSLYLFINDVLATKVEYCNWLTSTEETACGLFNEDCTASFRDYSVITDKDTLDTLIDNVSQKGIIETNGTWTEEDNAYINLDKISNQGGYKVIQEIESSKYVVSTTITLSETITTGARPGLIIAGNKQMVLAFAFCDNNIGFSIRPSWAGSLYTPVTTLTDSTTATLTVLRNGKNFYGFVNGNYITQYYCESINQYGDGALGFFNWGSDATFTDYSADTGSTTYNTWLAKLPKDESRPSQGTWDEFEEGKYTNITMDNWKVLEKFEGTKYVVTAKMTLESIALDGTRMGLIVASNNGTYLMGHVCNGNGVGLISKGLQEWQYNSPSYLADTTLRNLTTCVLTVVRDGSTYYFFMDGEYLGKLTSTFSAEAEGCLGIFAFGKKVTFEDCSYSTEDSDIATWIALTK